MTDFLFLLTKTCSVFSMTNLSPILILNEFLNVLSFSSLNLNRNFLGSFTTPLQVLPIKDSDNFV